MKQTNIKKYGVYNYSKTTEFAKNRNKKIKYDNLTFDSSWEVDVYKFCMENNIPCEYQPNIQLEYEYDGKKHIYQPDFLINDKLYEVKGDHFFKDGKMINPYNNNRNKISDVKHQCMIKNNVIILTSYHINQIKQHINIFT